MLCVHMSAAWPRLLLSSSVCVTHLFEEWHKSLEEQRSVYCVYVAHVEEQESKQQKVTVNTGGEV